MFLKIKLLKSDKFYIREEINYGKTGLPGDFFVVIVLHCGFSFFRFVESYAIHLENMILYGTASTFCFNKM